MNTFIHSVDLKRKRRKTAGESVNVVVDKPQKYSKNTKETDTRKLSITILIVFKDVGIYLV